MMREGNMGTFAVFPEGSDFRDMLHPIHRSSSASREDINENFENVVDNNSAVVFTPPIIEECCDACLFNVDVIFFKEVIVKEIRVLLNYHYDNQSNKHFMHRHFLWEIHEEMFVVRFCDHCHIDHVMGMRTNIFADDQRHHFEMTFRMLRHE